jgi:[acyl-carrier-protein] S-malonyltransferase
MTAQVAFLFPGQGSQAVGMGADVFASSPAAKHVFEAADEALGSPLSTLCFNGPEGTLRETIHAQPAIVTVSLALLAAFQEALSPQHSSWSEPLSPACTAGHSVGEYAALVAAGALDLREALLLVRDRGRFMHHEGTVCPGSMAAVIGMEEEQLQEVCQEATDQALAEYAARGDVASEKRHPGLGRVIVANYNAPGQIVISGEQLALQKAMELARARGAKRVIPLSVSGAFHSPVMLPAAARMAEVIATAPLRNTAIPVVCNLTAAPMTSAGEMRQELSQQVAASVQWTRTIQYMVGAGVGVFIEIGPGQALTGMVKRIAKGAITLNISNEAEIARAIATLRDADALY